MGAEADNAGMGALHRARDFLASGNGEVARVAHERCLVSPGRGVTLISVVGGCRAGETAAARRATKKIAARNTAARFQGDKRR